jgi:hypothetical protein
MLTVHMLWILNKKFLTCSVPNKFTFFKNHRI